MAQQKEVTANDGSGGTARPDQRTTFVVGRTGCCNAKMMVAYQACASSYRR